MILPASEIMALQIRTAKHIAEKVIQSQFSLLCTRPKNKKLQIPKQSAEVQKVTKLFNQGLQIIFITYSIIIII